MKTYCLSCRAKTDNEKLQPVKSGGRYMLKSKCVKCGNNKSRMLSEKQYKVLTKKENMKGGYIIPALVGLLGSMLIK